MNNKQCKKQYKKMIRKHCKKLNKLNKAAHKSPWDYGFGLNYFIAFLEFMQDYYNLGYNVWQTDESLTPLKESLKKALDAYYEWTSWESKFFHLDEEDVYVSKMKEDGTIELISKYPELHKEVNLAFFKEQYNQKRDKFFSIVSENLERWWD